MGTLPNIVKTFRENTKREMVLRGISQAELAKRLQITPASVSIMLADSDKWRPGLDTVQKVADAIGISPAAILLIPRYD